MSDDGNTLCPECGGRAPFCAACGRCVLSPGFAARDDDDDDEPPRRPVKKPARSDEGVRSGAPPKKKRPIDDEEEDDEPRRRVKKKRRRDEDDEPDEEPENLRDNTLLNMIFPVGVSVFAMGANYMGVLSLLAVIFGGVIAGVTQVKIIGLILPGVGALFGLIAIVLGGLSFIIRPKKTTYGSVTGYIRAIVGILCGLVGLIGAPVVIWFLSKM
jgi:hypothetical protein